MKDIDIQDKNDWARPPGEIKIHGMMVAEVFEESRFDELKEGLEEIYSDNNLEYRVERLKDIFERPSIGSWGNSNIQVKFADESEKDDLLGDRVQFEELGPYVEFVEFSLTRVSPSFMVLQIALHFSNEGRQILNDIYSYTHEEFREEITGAERIHNPTNLKKEEIQLVKDQATEDVMSIVENYFQGSLSRDSEDYEKLVKMPVYSLESLSDYDDSLDDEDQFEDRSNIEKFSISNSSFLNTLGVSFSDYKIYEHDYYFLSCDSNPSDVFTDFSVFTDYDLEKDMLEGRGEHWGVMDYLQMDFGRAVSLMALSRYAENFSHKVNTYSRELSEYENENYSVPILKSFRKFRKIKKLKDKRLSDRRNFSRFFNELEGYKPPSCGLELIETKEPFTENTRDYIQNLGDIQESISQDNDKFYQQITDLRKISANYTLQFWVFFLTLVIVVIEALRILQVI